MIKQNKKFQEEEDMKLGKKLALFEILIIIAGFIAISYILSDNLELVSASIASRMTPIPANFFDIEVEFNLWKFLGSQTTNIIANAGIALGLYWGVNALGNLLWKNDPEIAQQLALAVSIGYGAGTALSMILGAIPGIGTAGFLGGGIAVGSLFTVSYLGLAGIGAGLIIWFIAGTDYKIVTVTYNCNQWQAPLGGDDCLQCTKGKLPCTEYKCKSLGQSCEFVNGGTDQVACIYVNRTDIVAPIITPLKSVLKPGFNYTPDTTRSFPDEGVIINYTGEGADENGCIPPNVREVYYGVNLSERAICRMDRQRKATFDEMGVLTSRGLILDEHIFLDAYPSLIAAEYEGMNITKEGEYETHIRCQDANGNVNVGTFAFKYCVQKTPDRTPPSIQLTNPLNNMPIANNQNNTKIGIYLDKPSDCKWSRYDEEYSAMVNEMVCAKSIFDYKEGMSGMLYECSTTLTGLLDEEENVFYFRCKSYPLLDEELRYEMATSYKYTLIGTEDLVIGKLLPQTDSVVIGSSQEINVKLQVETSQGYKNGLANCYYKESSQEESSYTLFKDTNSYAHTQNLWLGPGTYKYDVKCIDLGGNADIETTEFKVETDIEPPLVVRMYNEGGSLKIITNEQASCVYSNIDCNYAFEDGEALTSSDGKEHYLGLGEKDNLYIKCKDSFNNKPSASQCSLIVRPL